MSKFTVHMVYFFVSCVWIKCRKKARFLGGRCALSPQASMGWKRLTLKILWSLMKEMMPSERCCRSNLHRLAKKRDIFVQQLVGFLDTRIKFTIPFLKWSSIKQPSETRWRLKPWKQYSRHFFLQWMVSTRPTLYQSTWKILGFILNVCNYKVV